MSDGGRGGAQNAQYGCMMLGLSPCLLPKGVLTPDTQAVKYNFAPSTALNKTARPFGAGTPPPDNSRAAQVTKTVTYNPPPPSYANNQTSRAQHQNGYVNAFGSESLELYTAHTTVFFCLFKKLCYEKQMMLLYEKTKLNCCEP